MIVSRLHQDVIARLAGDSRGSHLRVEGSLFVRKGTGYNARTLRVLARAGLVESQVFQGPRGGRIVGLKLTEAGLWVAQRIAAIAEGTAPVNGQGDFERNVATGAGTFTVEG